MKWLLVLGLAAVALVVIVACVGYMLPQHHEASRSAEVPRSQADLYALVADIKNYDAWWPNRDKVDVVVTEQSPPSRFVTKIVDGLPFDGTWTFEIVALGEEQSRLTITERGEIYNPVFRALARFVFGYTSTLDSCLEALKKRPGS